MKRAASELPAKKKQPSVAKAVFSGKEQTARLRTIISSVAAFSDSIRFNFNDDGIRVEEMCSAHVSFFTLNWRPEDLSEYTFGCNTSIDVPLPSLVKVMPAFKKSHAISLSFKVGGAGDFHVSGLSSTGTVEIQYKINALDVSRDTLGVPDDLQYEAVFMLASSELSEILSRLSPCHPESIVVSVTEQKIRFSATGEIGQGEVFYSASGENENVQDAVVKESITVSLSTKYIMMFSKAGKLSKFAAIKVSMNTPAVFQFSFGEKSNLTFYLAPRIEESD